MVEPPAPARRSLDRWRDGWRGIERLLPSARLAWIAVLALGIYGVTFFGTGLGVGVLIALPVTALVLDLVFQRLRFDSIRFPDAALATGMFLAVLLPPNVPLVAGIACTVAAVGFRHVIRFKGRPWFNPAASGLFLGAILFGLSAAWWGSINETLTISLGLLLLVWNRRFWRVPTVFLVSFAMLTVVQHAFIGYETGATVGVAVLLKAALDPSIVFFGLFLVPEPRTAPSTHFGQAMYGLALASGSALGPFLIPTLAPIVTLLVVNLAFVGVRWTQGRAQARGRPGPAASLRSGASRGSTPRAGWSLPQRVGAGIGVLLLLGILVPLAPSAGPGNSPILVIGSPPGHSVSSGRSSGSCLHDNAAIPQSTLTSLHKALGPSVILSDSTSTGLVVFYDPVNAVTVSETDMYEDFGYAEFNGDDYTVSGCVPP